MSQELVQEGIYHRQVLNRDHVVSMYGSMHPNDKILYILYYS